MKVGTEEPEGGRAVRSRCGVTTRRRERPIGTTTRPGNAPAPRRRGARHALAALLTLATAALGAVALAAAPLWLEPVSGGIAALFEDSRVLLLDHERDAIEAIAGGWQGDRLLACGGGLYGVDAVGRLAEAAGASGPRVSPHADPACLEGKRIAALSDDGGRVLLLDAQLEPLAERPVEALPDTELIPFGRYLALLVEPTFRYRHGVLGDELEAGAVLVLRQDDLSPVARWRVDERAVIEQRGVVPYPLDAPGDDPRWGLLLTRATPRGGAQVVALELVGGDLNQVGAGAEIGTGNRWLNLFAATDDHAYAVRTPHIGGPLERYALPNAAAGARARLTAERFDLGVTNHTIGSRNLDLGVLLPPGAAPPGVDLLVLARQDLRALRVVRCAERCQVTAELQLEGRLTSNLVATAGPAGGGAVLYAGDDSGAVHRFVLDVRGELRR